jgi:hypothetical protein
MSRGLQSRASTPPPILNAVTSYVLIVHPRTCLDSDARSHNEKGVMQRGDVAYAAFQPLRNGISYPQSMGKASELKSERGRSV